MKILLVHNYYGSEAPSGENSVFDSEIKLLKKFGNQVEVYSRSSDQIRSIGLFGKIIGATTTIINIFEYFNFKKKINSFKPDIIHIHNTFPLLSPVILYAIDRSIPTFVTLHNYRIFCASGIPAREGKICTLCIKKNTILYALKYRCYRNSYFATIPIVLNIFIYKKLNTWNKKVTNFIVLSEFHKNLFIQAGLDEKKIKIKPNFYSGTPKVIKIKKRLYDVVFVGRLSEEKGVFTLLKAWLNLGINAPKLNIIGDGPLKHILEKYCIENKISNVVFLGRLSQIDTEKFISQSKILILPSECYEGFPMVIREAFAWGTPVLASNLGSIPEIVENKINGELFDFGNSDAISRVVSNLIFDNDKLELYSNNAHNKFLSLYTELTNYEILINIYKKNNLNESTN